MIITIRKVSSYLEVSIKEGQVTVELGLLDQAEAAALAVQLRETADLLSLP